MQAQNSRGSLSLTDVKWRAYCTARNCPCIFVAGGTREALGHSLSPSHRRAQPFSRRPEHMQTRGVLRLYLHL